MYYKRFSTVLSNIRIVPVFSIMVFFLMHTPATAQDTAWATGDALISGGQYYDAPNCTVEMKVVGEDEDAYIFRDTTPDYFEFKIALDIITNNKKQENKKPKQELTITNNPGKDHTIKTYNNKEAIKIFNIKGQEIKTINPRNQKQIYWDGTDNNGKQTTKGIYIATQGNKTIGKIIELPEKTTQPTKTNTTNTTKINEKKTETIEREVSITLIPDSVYLIYHDTIMLKDTDNDFIPDIHLDSIPQTQDVTFKLRDGYTRKDLGGNGLKIITHAIPPPIAGEYYEYYCAGIEAG